MKRQHTYEKMIGQKLNGLAAPDVAGLWDGMEAILDREMPQQEKKKRLGAWWFHPNLLMAASLVLAIGGVYTFRYLSATTPLAQPGTNASLNEAKNASAPANDNSTMKETTSNSISGTAQKEETIAGTASSAKIVALQDLPDGKAVKKMIVSYASGQQNAGEKKQPAATNKILSTTNNITKHTAIEENTTLTTINNIEMPAAAETKSNMALASANDSASFQLADVEVTKPSETALFDEQNVKPLTPADIKRKLDLKKKAHVYLDKGLSFGVALNYPFAVNGQKKNELDMNGKKNNWQDYIPSVYAQLHLNRKFYVQAEWQPVTAQYTRNYTLYHNIDEPSPDEKNEKIVKLNKLFYSSLPLSVHYNTPLKNVSVGVGLQYSLLEKIILQDQENYLLIGPGRWDTMVLKNEVAVKDPKTINEHNTGDVVDNVAKSIRREDWRLLADVGYNYKGFSGGLRYTRGLHYYYDSNFTDLPVKARNESFQVYLRVNLFDTRKK